MSKAKSADNTVFLDGLSGVCHLKYRNGTGRGRVDVMISMCEMPKRGQRGLPKTREVRLLDMHPGTLKNLAKWLLHIAEWYEAEYLGKNDRADVGSFVESETDINAAVRRGI